MKVIDNSSKFKISFVIFLMLSLLVQPFCIMIYLKNDFKLLYSLFQFTLSSFYLYWFSIILTEYFFKKLLVGIMKGKYIKNGFVTFGEVVLFTQSVIFYLFWIADLAKGIETNYEIVTALMLINTLYIFINGRLILVDEYIILGFQIISTKTVLSYKAAKYKTEKSPRGKLEIKLVNNQSISFTRDKNNISALLEYLNSNNIECEENV